MIALTEEDADGGARVDRPRVAALPRALSLLRSTRADPAAIDRLLSDRGSPLVEDGAYTFVWRGDADAAAVEHRVLGLPRPVVMRAARDSGVRYATIRLPRGSRVEYQLLLRRGDSIETVNDPLNPLHAAGPWGSVSVLEAEGYATPAWAMPDPDAEPGSLVDLTLSSRALGREARVTLYLPARLSNAERLPLLVLHDGGDYLEYAALRTVLDNLMHRRRIADCIVALTHPGNRLVEYAASREQTEFLNSELVPLLERLLPVQAQRSGRVLGGASLGAIASLAAARAAPHLYGGLLLQSASLFASALERDQRAGPAVRPVATFTAALSANPQPLAARIFQSVGAFEPLAVRNRAMRSVMRQLGGETRYVEGLDGHNWTCWRDRLLDGLGWLLPWPM